MAIDPNSLLSVFRWIVKKCRRNTSAEHEHDSGAQLGRAQSALDKVEERVDRGFAVPQPARDHLARADRDIDLCVQYGLHAQSRDVNAYLQIEPTF